MQGILIDPKAKTITTCEINGKKPIQLLYTLMRCSIVEQVSLGSATVLLIDEEGKLAYPNKDGYFTLDMFPESIFAGCAIILERTKHSWKSTGISPAEVREFVHWCNPTEEQVKPHAFIFSW